MDSPGAAAWKRWQKAVNEYYAAKKAAEKKWEETVGHKLWAKVQDAKGRYEELRRMVTG